MADKIASGAYTVAATGASAVKTGASAVATGVSYTIDKADDGVEYAKEKWNPTVYKPAPLRDTFKSDMDNTR